MTHRSALAQWRYGWPSGLAAIQSGCAARTSSRAACGSVRAITCMPSARHPATRVPNGSVDPSAHAAVMQRDVGRIVGDDPAGAETGGVGLDRCGSNRARTARRSGRDRSRRASAAPSASACRTSRDAPRSARARRPVARLDAPACPAGRSCEGPAAGGDVEEGAAGEGHGQVPCFDFGHWAHLLPAACFLLPASCFPLPASRFLLPALGLWVPPGLQDVRESALQRAADEHRSRRSRKREAGSG